MACPAVWTLLALVAAVLAAPCTETDENEMVRAMSANVSTRCATSIFETSMTILNALIYKTYDICLHVSCSDDLKNLSASVPQCDEMAEVSSSIRTVCDDVTLPTTNGTACTPTDRDIYTMLRETSVWPYCSSDPKATLQSIAPRDFSSAKELCASDTCTSFINYVRQGVPNCTLQHRQITTLDDFQGNWGCTPAPPLAPCTMVDYMTMKDRAARTRVWDNCSAYLGLPAGATYTLLAANGFEASNVPSGYCMSTCPAFLLSVLREQSACKVDALSLPGFVNRAAIVTLCPSMRASGAIQVGGNALHFLFMAALLVYAAP